MAPFGFPSCSLWSFDGSIPSVKTGTLAQLTKGQGVMAGMSYRDVGEQWKQKAIARQNNRDRSRWYVYMMLFPRCYNLLELLPPSVLPSFRPSVLPSFRPSSPSFLPTANSRSQWALPGPASSRSPTSTARLPDLNREVRSQRSRSHCALLDLNRELQISVGTAGPQPRAPDLSGHMNCLVSWWINEPMNLNQWRNQWTDESWNAWINEPIISEQRWMDGTCLGYFCSELPPM